MTTRAALVLAVSCGMSVTSADSGFRPAQPPSPFSVERARTHNREASAVAEGSRSILRLDERAGDGLAWWPDAVLANGVIELDVRGKDVMQQSFIGVAFHGQDAETYDAIYFRPFNFKADPPRRARAVQYISHPAHTWSKLREERPGQFEREVSPAPDPNEWFHVRVVVRHPTVQVFVNDATTPALEVEQLSARKTGWVGVWVGNGSGGSFANVRVTPAP